MKTLQMEDIYWDAEIVIVKDTPVACSRCNETTGQFIEVRISVQPHATYGKRITINLPCGHSTVASGSPRVAPPDVLAALMLAATPTTYL